MTICLVICSKSTWEPAVRREHALARLATTRGHPVVFLERPFDVRSVGRAGVGTWAGSLLAPDVWSPEPGLSVVARSTPLPPHRGRLAEIVDCALLRTTLRARSTPPVAVVATTPWHWPAVRAGRSSRRVFDCGDDWSSILASRAPALASRYRDVGREADAVVAASDALAGIFGSAAVTVVRNGVGSELVGLPLAEEGSPHTMVHVGTLSERFDVALVTAVLDRLPDWRLDLYGQCQYRGRGERPGAELARLLASRPDRVAWHGITAGRGLRRALDRSAVLVIPHRRAGAVTGDSMKLYAYAARGRPVVTTSWAPGLAALGPPDLYIADGAERFAATVARAAAEDTRARALGRRRWAESHTWERRWPAWSAAIFGN